jgi:hypothetical protein
MLALPHRYGGGQRQGQIGGFPHGRRLARAARLGSCSPDNGTDLAEKADTAMYESDEDRIDAAELLAEQNPRAASEAFSAIACDRAVGDEVRLSAAELLADVDPGAAAPACLAIARDRTVGDEVRLSAAERLADVNPRAAAPACLAIACDQAVGDEVRLSAAELLADVDPGAAARPAWPLPATRRSATRYAVQPPGGSRALRRCYAGNRHLTGSHGLTGRYRTSSAPRASKRATAAAMSSTANATWRMPGVFAGACRSPPRPDGA